MSPELSFLAQSLDNRSPDPAALNGCQLGPDDEEKHQELVRKISQVSISGRRVFSEGFISAHRRYGTFILKIPSVQRDSSGRIAPIICYGRVPKKPAESWPEDVTDEMKKFAASIGRKISDQDISSGREAVEAVLKKTRVKDLLRKIKTLTPFWKKTRRKAQTPRRAA